MHIAPTYACTHVHVHTHIGPWPGCVMDKSKLCETHAAQTRFCYPGRHSEASRATRCGAHYLRTRYLREQVWHADLPLSRHGQRVQQGRVNSRKRLSCRCPSLWERPPLWIFVWGFSFNTSNCFNWGTAYAQLSSNLKCEIQWVLANAHTHSVPTQSPLLSRCSPSPVPKPLISLLPFPGVRVIGLTTQAATVSVPCTLSLAALLWAGPTLLADEGCPQCATCHQLWHSCGYCKTLGGFPSLLGTGLSFPSPVMLCVRGSGQVSLFLGTHSTSVMSVCHWTQAPTRPHDFNMLEIM